MQYEKVKLKFMHLKKNYNKDKSETLVYWPASNVPINPNFSVETNQETNKSKIVVKDFITFSSDDSCNEEVNYFFATRDKNGRLNCFPAHLYRMMPDYSFKDEAIEDNDSNETIRLTKKEQMDELKEKFGSRKSQRDLASKRKYEIQFGEDDVDNLPSLKSTNMSELNETNDSMDTSVVEEKSLSTILPERNSAAKNVDEVYSMDDILSENEEKAISEYEEQLFSVVKNEYIKQLATKFDEINYRVLAIYADILLQLVKLSAYEMRKADPLPLIEGDIKKLIFDRYTSTKQCSSRSLRYIITDQNKDRIFIYVFIIILKLNNYKPIELEKLQTYCKLPMNHIRRILELIGCYIENMKNSSGINVKVARFRLPLNVYKEPKSKRFRR